MRFPQQLLIQLRIDRLERRERILGGGCFGFLLEVRWSSAACLVNHCFVGSGRSFGSDHGGVTASEIALGSSESLLGLSCCDNIVLEVLGGQSSDLALDRLLA